MSSTTSSSNRPTRKRAPSRRHSDETQTVAPTPVETTVDTSSAPKVVTPSKPTGAKTKHTIGATDVASRKEKKPKSLPSLSDFNFEIDDGINSAYDSLYVNSRKSRPSSRRELLVDIFEKYNAPEVKTFFSHLCPHEKKPGTKRDTIDLLVQFICNTHYALKGPVDSRTSPTDRYVICIFVHFKQSDWFVPNDCMFLQVNLEN